MRTFAPLLPLFLLAGCEAAEFDAPSKLTSVRVLATRADAPYAPPGATVTLEALAVDARENPSEPMQVYWLETPCFNPTGDAYHACFPAFGAEFPRGEDLTAKLHAGTTFTFHMPEDVIETHSRLEGQPEYGLAVVFNMACAGHVEYHPELARSPGSVPFACYDASGQKRGAEDFVFAFSLVHAFADRSNENPVLEGVTYGGTPIDLEAGLELTHCNESSIDDCPATKLDVVVPDSSQELDPGNLSVSGSALKETLYVQYYATGGKLANDATVVRDAREGHVENTGNDFRAPLEPGEYQLWVVLRDNRGGVTWQHVPLHVR